MGVKPRLAIFLLFGPLLGVCQADEDPPVAGHKANEGAVNRMADRFSDQIEQSIKLLKESKTLNDEEFKKLVAQNMRAKSSKERLKVFQGWLKQHPKSAELSYICAVLAYDMRSLDDARTYIDQSLAIQTSDRSLELYVMICVLKDDFDGLTKKLDDLEAVEAKSPLLIRVLLVLSEQNKDINLFHRTTDYITKHKIQDPKVIRDQKKLAEFFEDEKDRR